MPLIDSMFRLLYPDAKFVRTGYTTQVKCDTEVYQKAFSNEAFAKASDFIADGGQVLLINSIDDEAISKKYFMAIENENFTNHTCAQIYKGMKSKEVVGVLKEFNEGEIDVLFCSNIRDFFIDSKKPLMIIVDDADRKGLSLLHQIRNYAIKNGENSKLALISFSKRKEALDRLEGFKQNLDGHSIVYNDLKMRKDASKIGFVNWGFPVLNLLNPVKDEAIVKTANKDAKKTIENDVSLKNPENKFISYAISQNFWSI